MGRYAGQRYPLVRYGVEIGICEFPTWWRESNLELLTTRTYSYVTCSGVAANLSSRSLSREEVSPTTRPFTDVH